MKKCVIFGAGFYGKEAFDKLNKYYEIVYYVDNNCSLHEKFLHGIEIISISNLGVLLKKENVDIVICSRAYYAIANQLLEMGIKEYFVMLDGFLYHSGENEVLIPVELEKNEYYKKKEKEKNILYIQRSACIRTHKIAYVMKNQGYKVFLLYTLAPPTDKNKRFAEIYDKIWGFSTMKGIEDFIQNSEFDVIHCSNEPDILATIVNMTSIPVIFDTHDMQSIGENVTIEQLVLEYCANTYSDGNMYTSDSVVDIAKEKYKLESNKIFVLENMVLDEWPCIPLKKLSSVDGEIHCVYEGGIEGRNKDYHRYFEDIWMKIVNFGIHIHFYSQSDKVYCEELASKSPYLHYEGSMGSEELISEMTKYDCGLAIFNVNERNRLFLETGTANKVYEYLNSRIPVLVGDVHSYEQFVSKYHVGGKVDLSKDIKMQIEEICKIKIPKNFLSNNKFTMMSKGKEMQNYYEKLVKQYKDR